MPEEAETEPGELCLRCGNPNAPGAPRCGNCNAPLGSLSTGAPWEMGKTRDVAYQSQTDPKLKPIVFYGVWLYFGPTALGALMLVVEAAREAITSPPITDPSHSLLFTLLAFFYLAFSVWALTAVTRRYLRRSHPDTTDG